jgi:hypothetical protein
MARDHALGQQHVQADTIPQRASDAYRAAYDDCQDVVRYLERLADAACKPLVLAEMYAEDHPASTYAPEAIEAAREVRDLLCFLVERMHGLRRSLAHQAYAEVWRTRRETVGINDREAGL